MQRSDGGLYHAGFGTSHTVTLAVTVSQADSHNEYHWRYSRAGSHTLSHAGCHIDIHDGSGTVSNAGSHTVSPAGSSRLGDGLEVWRHGTPSVKDSMLSFTTES